MDFTGGIGKVVSSVVEKGGEIISKLVADKDLATQLTHELKAQLNSNMHEYETLVATIARDIHAETQATVRAELHQSDLYTKRTRPKIARQSWYACLGYLLAIIFTSAAPGGWGFTPLEFHWFIFMAIASPAYTYMGIRGFEKWSGKNVEPGKALATLFK
jgi:hypothetical protein